MAVQPFLIKCHPHCGAVKVKALLERIIAWGGQVLLLTEGGRAIVIHIDDALRDAIAARPEVALIDRWVNQFAGGQGLCFAEEHHHRGLRLYLQRKILIQVFVQGGRVEPAAHHLAASASTRTRRAHHHR